MQSREMFEGEIGREPPEDKPANTKVVHLPALDGDDRLVLKFSRNGGIEIYGTAGSADMALAAAVLSSLAVNSLDQ